MAAEGMQFPWRGNSGTISPNLGVIWEMSDEAAREHGERLLSLWKNVIFMVLGVGMLVLAATYVLVSLDPRIYVLFREGAVFTWVSFVILVGIAVLSLLIFRARHRSILLRDWRSPHALWLIIALGFFILAVDEVMEGHEKLDRLIHWVVGIDETSVTDGLDDIIVFAYALIGIVALFHYRTEIFTDALLPFAAGFAFLFLMVVLDLLTNRGDILLWLIGDVSNDIWVWLKVSEDTFKLVAEFSFLTGVLYCYRLARLKPH